MTEAEKIAKGLTEAQREALAFIHPHSIIAPYRYRHEIPALLDQGLIIESLDRVWVSTTPSGLEVRHILENLNAKG